MRLALLLPVVLLACSSGARGRPATDAVRSWCQSRGISDAEWARFAERAIGWGSWQRPASATEQAWVPDREAGQCVRTTLGTRPVLRCEWVVVRYRGAAGRVVSRVAIIAAQGARPVLAFAAPTAVSAMVKETPDQPDLVRVGVELLGDRVIVRARPSSCAATPERGPAGDDLDRDLVREVCGAVGEYTCDPVCRRMGR